jgi:hypothetical protein
MSGIDIKNEQKWPYGQIVFLNDYTRNNDNSIREKMTMAACHETDVDVNENGIVKILVFTSISDDTFYFVFVTYIISRILINNHSQLHSNTTRYSIIWLRL